MRLAAVFRCFVALLSACDASLRATDTHRLVDNHVELMSDRNALLRFTSVPWAPYPGECA